jgi:hypothetical protein
MIKRSQRRAESLARARAVLAHLPTLDVHSRDGNEAAVGALVELRGLVAAARRRARRHSLTRVLLRDAYARVDAWLREWEAGELPASHLVVLSRQMIQRMEDIARRLSTVVELETQQARAPDWPSGPDGP